MNWKNLWEGLKYKFKNDQEFTALTMFLSAAPFWFIAWIITLFVWDDMNWFLAIFLFIVYGLGAALTGVVILYGIMLSICAWQWLKEVEEEGAKQNNPKS